MLPFFTTVKSEIPRNAISYLRSHQYRNCPSFLNGGRRRGWWTQTFASFTLTSLQTLLPDSLSLASCWVLWLTLWELHCTSICSEHTGMSPWGHRLHLHCFLLESPQPKAHGRCSSIICWMKLEKTSFGSVVFFWALRTEGVPSVPELLLPSTSMSFLIFPP